MRYLRAIILVYLFAGCGGSSEGDGGSDTSQNSTATSISSIELTQEFIPEIYTPPLTNSGALIYINDEIDERLTQEKFEAGETTLIKILVPAGVSFLAMNLQSQDWVEDSSAQALFTFNSFERSDVNLLCDANLQTQCIDLHNLAPALNTNQLNKEFELNRTGISIEKPFYAYFIIKIPTGAPPLKLDSVEISMIVLPQDTPFYTQWQDTMFATQGVK